MTDGINPVHEQIARYTDTYNNATNEIGLVLAARKHEDLNWVLEYSRDQYGTFKVPTATCSCVG